MSINKFLFIIFVIIIIFPNNSLACTTFCFHYNGDWIYGRNFDWQIEHCLIMVNKRGAAKVAYTENNPAKWVSKYGSITFNQYGREFPLGGMNEAGLVIECMWLQQTEYPPPDSRSELSELQWIQYQLDNFETVDEVTASDKIVRIAVKSFAPLHFLVCDRKGRAAVFEFLGGKMKVHTRENLPFFALTNSTYENSKRLLETLNGDEQIAAFKNSNYSLKRFIWAALGVSRWDPKRSGSPIDYAFKILKKVSVNRTMFRVVYDVKNGRIYFRTKSNPNTCFLNFDRFDFACSTPVKILDISSDRSGDVTTSFSNYTFNANYDLIQKSFSGTSFLKDVPERVLQDTARYPETLVCEK